ncbi:MAG: GntR family transcriptional regulator [Clostridia bacterium]|nr:GntR family transcriptional regulator [Clostridia bacterium]
MIQFDINDHKPLREVVYDQLKKGILLGEIKPGTRLMEVELAEIMRVSRTPIREAIRKLENEGLVEIEARRGAYVADVSYEKMLDALEVRKELEGMAAKLAANSGDKEAVKELRKINNLYEEAVNKHQTEDIVHYDVSFHKKLAAISGNEMLIQLMERVQESVTRFRYIFYEEWSRYASMPSEHSAIIKGIEDGDYYEARTAAKVHIDDLIKFIEEQVEQRKEQ